MIILGVSGFYHDSAAALIVDGEIVAAAQEERFTRKKHDPRFPINAILWCLEFADIDVNDCDYIAFYDKPFVKFERLLMTYVGVAPKGLRSFYQQIPPWLKQKLSMRTTIQKQLGYTGEVLFTNHHEAHAASAFFPSPFEDAAIVTLDGVGEWQSTTYSVGRGNKIEMLKEINFPHSLGLLYSAFTYFSGFKVNSGEYKLMGLAPYGEPTYVDRIKDYLIDIKDDGSYHLNMKYFDYCSGHRMTNDSFAKLFDGPARVPESKITQREMDLAKSIQVVIEDVVLLIAKHVYRITGLKNLCLAGGVALNCVANGKIIRQGPFENVWIQPAAGDAGSALGAALAIWHCMLGNQRTVDALRQKSSYLGPEFTDDQIELYLKEHDIPYERVSEDDLYPRVADMIASERVVGWFQGRMEFGPRALGARSIIGDARSRAMQSTLNLKIKFRESFRPFAPSVLFEHVSECFELTEKSPYMLVVADVSKKRLHKLSPEQAETKGFDRLEQIRSDLPAITHVDNSARIQTVEESGNLRYYSLLKAFHAQTGCPVIINTSFNVRGEPIVRTPEEAYTCFMRTKMDFLALGTCLLTKEDQDSSGYDEHEWQEEFELD